LAGPSTNAKTSNSLAELADTLSSALDPIARTAGFDLESVEIVPAGRRRLLRVVVDRDGGVDLDAVAVASREFSAALDATDVMGPAPYVLEVTSPGVDRPLTLPRHWRRAIGRLVSAPLEAGGDLRGRIVTADDVTVTMDVDGEHRVIAMTELGGGQVQLEFNRSVDQGGGGAA